MQGCLSVFEEYSEGRHRRVLGGEGHSSCLRKIIRGQEWKQSDQLGGNCSCQAKGR